jgi:hypothetical protein
VQFPCFSWTEQQRVQAAKEGLGYRLIFTGRLVIRIEEILSELQANERYLIYLLELQVGALVVLDALFFGAQRIGPLLQELQSH